MGFTGKELIQFMDKLVELASEENRIFVVFLVFLIYF
jgi:hypothetical protein